MIKDCVVSILISVSMGNNASPATVTVPLNDMGNGAACVVLDKTASRFQDCTSGADGITYTLEVETISDERLTIEVDRMENPERHVEPRRVFVAADLYLNGHWDMREDDFGFGWEVELEPCTDGKRVNPPTQPE